MKQNNFIIPINFLESVTSSERFYVTWSYKIAYADRMAWGHFLIELVRKQITKVDTYSRLLA